ncbi:MAG TPA: hypothetical protein VM582_10280, partial [Candidatus Thermoplasmatota archaeon]|nr:hypothetical protein [Candidatus Thermoplasmatota archaeon]
YRSTCSPAGWSARPVPIELVASPPGARILVAWDDGPEEPYVPGLVAPPGEHVLRYRAEGGIVRQATFRVDVDDPRVTLDAPSVVTLGSSVVVRVRAEDDASGVVERRAWMESESGERIPLALGAKDAAEATPERAGRYTIVATAVDAAGRAAVASAPLVVQPPPPPEDVRQALPAAGDEPAVAPVPVDPTAPSAPPPEAPPPDSPPREGPTREVPALAPAMALAAAAAIALALGRRRAR